MFRANFLNLLVISCLFVSPACEDDGTKGLATRLVATGAGTPQPAGKLATGVVVQALDDAGNAAEPTTLTVTLKRGGGEVLTQMLTTDASGKATLDWRMGIAPVPNVVTVSTPELSLDVSVEVVVDPTLTPTPFGDVNQFLADNDIDGTTEDLAFNKAGDTLSLGVPGGILNLTPAGAASLLPLTGDPLDGPLGLAYQDNGDLWVCDGEANALSRISASGAVTRLITNDGADDLVTPNHLAFGPDGFLYFTDSCLGRLYRVDPATGTITGRLDFDLPNEGGPNGVAFASDGALYVTTENTNLLCGHTDVGLTDPVAGLYSTTIDGKGFAEKTAVAKGVGLFGDGLAFDVEGNLYAIFDTVESFQLDESIVFVLPAGGTELRRFFAVEDQILANLAFGTDAFGTSTLYLTLLSFQPFVPVEARGVLALDVGIAGAPLY